MKNRSSTLFVCFILLAIAALSAAKPGKDDCELILNKLHPFALKMLKRYGSFRPFGAVITRGGKLQMSNPPLEAGTINDEVGRRRYTNVYKEQAKQGDIIAAGLVMIVEVKPYNQKTTKAIKVTLEHVLGYAADVFYPYTIQSGKPVFGKTFAGEIERVVFPKKEKSNRPF